MVVPDRRLVPQRLHVRVGYICSNKCVFCNDAGQMWRAILEKRTSDDVRRMIFDFPGTDYVVFDGGEPTLCPDLPQYLSWARERGFRRIRVASNGRRFAYLGYLRKLIDSGLNAVSISIHGHTPALHCSLTRSQGSFDQTLAGLKNCAAFARRHMLRLKTVTVINGRNLSSVRSIHNMLSQIQGIEDMVYTVMFPTKFHSQSLFAGFDEIVQAFSELCRDLSPEIMRRMWVVDLPPCAMSRLPTEIRGTYDDDLHYMNEASTRAHNLKLDILSRDDDTERTLPAPGCDSSRELSGKPDDLGNSAGDLSRSTARREMYEIIERFTHKDVDSKEVHELREQFTRQNSDSHGAYEVLMQFAHKNADSEPHAAPAEQGSHGEDLAVPKRMSCTTSPADNATPQSYYLRNGKRPPFYVKGPPCCRCSAHATCPGVWTEYARRLGWKGVSPI